MATRAVDEAAATGVAVQENLLLSFEDNVDP